MKPFLNLQDFSTCSLTITLLLPITDAEILVNLMVLMVYHRIVMCINCSGNQTTLDPYWCWLVYFLMFPCQCITFILKRLPYVHPCCRATLGKHALMANLKRTQSSKDHRSIEHRPTSLLTLPGFQQHCPCNIGQTVSLF